MKHARDLMTKKPSTICEDDTLDDLLQLFLSTNFKVIPVTDASGDVIALITELGLLKALSQKKANANLRLIKDHANCFSPPSFIDAEDTFGEFIPKILQSDSHRAVVVSKGSKKALGVISPSNIIKAIVGMSPDSAKMKQELDQASDKAEKEWKSSNTTDIFSQAFNASPYMMVLTDKDENIIELNERFLKTSSYTKEEIIGKNLRTIFPPFTNKQITQALHNARANGKCPTQPTALLKKDTKYLNVDMAISGIRDEKYKLMYFSIVLRELNGSELYENLP